MTRIKAILLALRIEYHWWHIKRSRKKFDNLYAAGASLCAPRVQRLNARTSKHVARVMVCEKKYRDRYLKMFDGVLF